MHTENGFVFCCLGVKEIKKTTLIVFSAAVLLAAVCFIYFGTSKISTLDEDRYEQIKNARLESDFFPIKTLKINGNEAVESQGELWWLCTVPEGTDYSKLNISFTGQTRTVRLAVLKQEYAEDAMGGDAEIKLMAYSPKYYREYSLRLTSLPIFSLYLGGALSRDDVPAVFSGIDAQVHLRGSSTVRFPKVGMKLELCRNAAFLGMRSDDDWVLNACYNDAERVRNVFNSQLWYDSCAGDNLFHVLNGNEYRFIELFLNGKYFGLYALGHKPDQKQFDIRNGEFLYSKTIWDSDEYELQGSKTKASEKEAFEALNAPYVDDAASAMDLWLFVELINGIDNSGKNYYMALKNNGGVPTAVYVPWDMDITWGMDYDPDAQNMVSTEVVSWDNDCRIVKTGIPELLSSGDTKTIQELKARYFSLREKEWSAESMNRYLDRYENEIFKSGAYLRDVHRWPDSSQLTSSDIGLSQLREYIPKRLEWMDGLMAELEEHLY